MTDMTILMLHQNVSRETSDSGGDQDNYRIYIMTAAVQEMQYNLYVFQH